MEEMSDCEYSFLEALGRDKVNYPDSTQNGGLGQTKGTLNKGPLFAQNIVKTYLCLGNHIWKSYDEHGRRKQGWQAQI